MFGYCWKDVGLSSSRKAKLKEDLEETCEVIEVKPKKKKKKSRQEIQLRQGRSERTMGTEEEQG